MKKGKHKGKKKRMHNNNQRQQTSVTVNEKAAEDDCGISDEAANRMEQKLAEVSGIGHKVIRDSSLEKMSDILLEYAEPFMENIDIDNKEEYNKAIMMSIMLWNCAIMQESQADMKSIEKILKPLMQGAEAKSVMNYMMERKRQMYPENKRLIVSYDLAELGEGSYHLSVASTIHGPAVKNT